VQNFFKINKLINKELFKVQNSGPLKLMARFGQTPQTCLSPALSDCNTAVDRTLTSLNTMYCELAQG